MKKVKVGIILIIVLMISLNAQPRPQFPSPPPKGDMMDLNLTDSQKETMKELKFEHEENMINLKSEVKKAELEIKKLMSTENFDVSDLKSLLSEKRAVENKIEDAKFEHWVSVYKILDESQKNKWEKRLMMQLNDRNKTSKHKKMHHERMKKAF